MARARNIKPSIMDNEQLAELEPLARLLFIYLWMLADREGRLEDRPRRIAAQALPYDRATDVDALLDVLHRAGFIVRYQAEGIACIQVSAFTKHQNPHVRESASALPAMDQGTAKAVTKHNLGSAEASPRSPDSGFLIPDSGFLIPDSGLGTPAPAAQDAPPPPKRRATQIQEDFAPNETGIQYAQQRGVGVDGELQAFRNHHQARGTVLKDWQAGWRTWCDKAVEFGRAGSARQPPPHRETFRERDERLAREKWDEITGRHRRRQVEAIDITPEPLLGFEP